MREVLKDLDGFFCYFSDRVMFFDMFDDHVDTSDAVLKHYLEVSIIIKLGKCLIAFKPINFVGYSIREEE